MDVREKLVELIQRNTAGFVNPYAYEYSENAEQFADYIIANGVTIQKWIPVSDPPKEKGKYLVLNEYGFIYSADYSKIHKGFGDWFDDIDGDWGYFAQDMGVTHWMPMPQPQKGE